MKLDTLTFNTSGVDKKRVHECIPYQCEVHLTKEVNCFCEECDAYHSFVSPRVVLQSPRTFETKVM